MKSSIIKAVTQTQFETCVTAFIALDFKLKWEELSGWDLRYFPCLQGNDRKTLKFYVLILLKSKVRLLNTVIKR